MVEIAKWAKCEICENDYCEHCGEARCVAACSGYTTKPKPQTNADRIRAMIDEELAKFLEDTGTAGCIEPARNCRASCTECILDWLRQPVKDGDNDG